MLNLDWTIIWTVVNLLILFLLLKRFLFGPITKMMESRTAEIENSIQDAEQKNAQAEAKNAAYAEKLETAHVQAAEIVSEAQARAQKEYDKTLKEAQRDAQKAAEKARQQMELEREQVLREAKDNVADVVLAAAAKLSQKELNAESDRRFVDDFLSEVGDNR